MIPKQKPSQRGGRNSRIAVRLAGVQEIARGRSLRPCSSISAAMGLTRPPPQTESELIEAWWAAGGYNVPREAADADSGRCSISRKSARLPSERTSAGALKGPKPSRAGKPETGQNRRRGVAGTAYKFTHDIFFEWAFFRLLIDRGDDWPEALMVPANRHFWRVS